MGSLSRNVAAILVGGAILTAACSAILDTNADQCSSDGDCARFSGRVCRDGVCVLGAATLPDGAAGDGGDAGEAGACVPKVPSSQDDFLNEPCTNAQCIPFDDCARTGVCDAALPALLDPPEGGV